MKTLSDVEAASEVVFVLPKLRLSVQLSKDAANVLSHSSKKATLNMQWLPPVWWQSGLLFQMEVKLQPELLKW